MQTHGGVPVQLRRRDDRIRRQLAAGLHEILRPPAAREIERSADHPREGGHPRAHYLANDDWSLRKPEQREVSQVWRTRHQSLSTMRKSFQNFLADMGPRPSPKHSIDRIDNDRGYSPSNCRWATAREQAQNTRYTLEARRVEFNGRAQTISEWAKELVISPKTIRRRLRDGRSAERALTQRGLMRNRLQLSSAVDGFGFYYGWAERDGERVRVDVLPPAHLWRGDVELEGQGKPDLKAWVIFVDGEEFARVERREDLPAILGLEGPPRPRGLMARILLAARRLHRRRRRHRIWIVG